MSHMLSHCLRNSKKGAQVRPEVFVFCEKTTGEARFKVEAGADGRMSEDQAASLLAMHCLVRGQVPSDYMVMIAIDEDLQDGLTCRAQELLVEAARAIASSRQLSRRQQEVFDGVVDNLANKEIAARLNISERTVKFHVSALLAKFHVRGRVDLMRKAVSALLPDSLSGAIPQAGFRIFGRKPRRGAPQGRKVRQHSRKGDRVVWPPGGQISA